MKRYLLLLLVLTLFPAGAHAATLSLGGTLNVKVGDTFNVPVLVYTEGSESANAVSGTVVYPAQLLTLVSVSKGGSVITLWPSEPTQSSGLAHFEGVILNPGWSGQGGTVVTLTFQARSPGTASATFSDASVLANDGKATPILSGTVPASIVVHSTADITTAPAAIVTTPTPGSTSGIVITSSTNPDQNKWYNKSSVIADWKVSVSATAVRIGYDKYSSGQPTVVYDPSTTHKELILKDGTWYFHVQQNVGGVWSAVSTFKINIDTTPPAALHIQFPHGTVTNDPRPIALFNTTDALSGMSYYTVSVNGNGTVRLATTDVSSNPYAVPVQNPGTSTLTVTAYDSAGNSVTSSSEFTVNGLNAPTLDPVGPISTNDILQVSGLTYPNSRIDLYVKDSAGNTDTQWARTSSNGAFRIIWVKHLAPGQYAITAQITDDTGAKSFVSTPATLQVNGDTPSVLRNILFNYAPFSFMVIALLLIAGYLLRFPLMRRLVKPIGLTPAHARLHAQFTELHEAIVKEMFAMRHAKTKRQLSEEEEKFLEHFEKILNKVEKNIEKSL